MGREAIAATEAKERIQRDGRLANVEVSTALYISEIVIRSHIQSKIDYLFEACVFEEEVSISDINTQVGFNFIGCHFKKGCHVEKSLLGDLRFHACNFSLELNMYEVNLTKGVKLKDCVAHSIRLGLARLSYIRITSVLSPTPLINKIEFAENSETSMVLLDGLEVGYTSFSSMPEDLYVGRGCYSSFHVHDQTPIKALLFNPNLNQLAGRSAPRLRIDLLKMNDSVLTGPINMAGTEIGEFMFTTMKDGGNGSLNITNSSIEALFDLSSSSLKSFFGGLQLATTAEVCFENTDLTDTEFVNVQWSKGNALVSTKREKPEHTKDKDWQLEGLHSLRHSYRQLKNAMTRQGNHIDALAFYRNEMRTHLHSICSDWSLSKLPDKIIHFLNLITSNFGQNWILPLLWLIGIQSLLYFKLSQLEITSVAVVDIEQHSCAAFWVGFKESIAMLNPTYKLDTSGLNGADKSTYGFILVLMRLFFAYFIYHFIRASRRYAFK